MTTSRSQGQVLEPAPSTDAMADTVDSDAGANAGTSAVRRRGSATASLCGRTLHHFRVDELIGRGGMGTVYRAHDLSLDRPVALKVLDADVVDDTESRDRFIREARAQARLTHPHVVQIHYIGEQDGLWFFAMELVDGGSLDDVLARGGRLEWTKAIDLLIGVSEALALAGRHGIVHRDLKPSNLLLDRDGRIKVADFGLAKWVSEDAKITQEGCVLGTPLYMSPEQGQGEPADHRSDIYSLGATFYHLLVGRPAFTADTPMAIVVKKITQPLPPLRGEAGDVPEALAAVVERMMAREPGRRFESHEAVIAALEGARPRKSVPAGMVVRSMALLVDLVLVGIVAGVLHGLVVVPYLAYQVLGWWRRGQTVGKWLFRLHVRTHEGGPAPLASCVLRAFLFNLGVLIVIGFTLFSRVVTGQWLPPPSSEGSPIGLLAGLTLISSVLSTAIFWGTALFRRDRRGLHDLLARTAVFYKLES